MAAWNTPISSRSTTTGASPTGPTWCSATCAAARSRPASPRRHPAGRRGARSCVTQVGAALSTAHRAGVVHRDVKPANVFLDESGNFYLGDFGIALKAPNCRTPGAAALGGVARLRLARTAPPRAGRAAGRRARPRRSRSTRPHRPVAVPRRADPRRPAATPAAPTRPDRCAPTRTDVPVAVDDVIARATAETAADRYQTLTRSSPLSSRRWTRLAGVVAPSRRGAATAIGGRTQPVQGSARLQRGRRRRLQGPRPPGRPPRGRSVPAAPAGRFAVVVGPSGIGKSSVVRAGLLPALRRGAVPGSEQWFVATMLPGVTRSRSWAQRCCGWPSDAPANLMGRSPQIIVGSPGWSRQLVPEGRAARAARIDQFEELFTLCEDPAKRRRFLDALEYALTDARCPLRWWRRMRADFYDRPLRHGTFARLIEPSTVPVTALAPDELERAIVEPAPRRSVASSSRAWCPRSSPTSATSRERCRCCSTH